MPLVYMDEEIEVYAITEEELLQEIIECVERGASTLKDLRDCLKAKNVMISDDKIGKILMEHFGTRIVSNIIGGTHR